MTNLFIRSVTNWLGNSLPFHLTLPIILLVLILEETFQRPFDESCFEKWASLTVL